MFGLPLLATQNATSEFDIYTHIVESRGVVQAVLITLVVMSLVSWFVVIYKSLFFARLRRSSKKFVDAYWEAGNPGAVYELAKDGPPCPESRVFIAGFRELGNLKQAGSGAMMHGFENVERAVRRGVHSEVARFEKWLGILATTGSTAPFIGLLGTVWGIMRALPGREQLLDQEANLLTTMIPPFGEALIATAVGLFAAIPAVMAYNHFVQKTRRLGTDIDGFGADFLNTLRRAYFSSAQK